MKFKNKRQHKTVSAPRLGTKRSAASASSSGTFDLSDATWEAEQGTPESVFDRVTGPYGSFDEGT